MGLLSSPSACSIQSQKPEPGPPSDIDTTPTMPSCYEKKYGEDEVFKEMARIWKVFLDECGKFDSEMV